MNRIVLVMALAGALSPGFAHKVRVDYDHGRSFSHFKTYSWGSPPDGTVLPAQWGEGAFPNQLMQERIVAYVEEALAARGLRRVQKGGDLVIAYQIQVSEEQQLTTVGSGFGWGWDGGGVATTTMQTFLKGTLVVDMVDGRQNKLVFQGVSTQSVSSRPGKNTKKLQKAVAEIFERYPPRL
jgi:hypothetical protein